VLAALGLRVLRSSLLLSQHMFAFAVLRLKVCD